MNNGLLKGKKGIIFGALNEKSIAWQVALKAHHQGARLVLTNSPVAVRMGSISELAALTSSKLVVADATSMVDIDRLVSESLQIFGGRFDFVLHSIGMSPNVRKDIPYENTSYENMLKTYDISALSFHRILQTCYKYDAINEWGSVVALTYVAAQRTLAGYNDMGDAKALLESIARSFGYIYGRDRKVRINTISQSPTPTTAGSGVHGIESLLDFSERMSPLGNATAAECADYCVTLFSDLTRKVTMQNLYHDGGFSSMGMSLKAIEQYNKSFKECDEK
ncbi:MAG TPA: SDR family oxidoreductase [Bacteroidales bacterium]|jgi:enoyl-[acyl-carrier protein] reductase I|nr:SDR family oxidoreductase [Bacteroidales bacterium]MDI9552492.1 SDR family oxidoreductase [Bacteroidota bacterium]MBP7039045.1 SDR family oxidoreductase [Bacteroidales bacterium]MZP65097.1 SDR family oxidoreductase [Bacteroidales bacterium]HNY53896.1 SDR family oxidoreductase [Bacteroidales bacterium]